MALIELGSLYVALRKAGVPEEDALKAAEEIAEYKQQHSTGIFAPPRIGTSRPSMTDSIWFFPAFVLIGLMIGLLLPPFAH